MPFDPRDCRVYEWGKRPNTRTRGIEKMKIAFVYPPLGNGKEFPLLGQNRQFRYSASPHVRIYPLIPASAVTLLRRSGFDSLLLDAINRRIGKAEFYSELETFDPDVVVLETKTPLMPRLWGITNRLKERFDKVVLVGDHASARPEESLRMSKADYILQGGDYDLGLLRLTKFLDDGDERKPGGLWYREGKMVRHTGRPEWWQDLDQVPFIDRSGTGWEIYGEAYLNKPSTYILTGRGCGGKNSTAGRCSFCSWQEILWNHTYRFRSPSNVADELEAIVEDQRPREVFDDNESGMTWNPEWLEEFKKELDSRGLIDEVMLSSNSRADSLNQKTCNTLSQLGFRLLKIGVESGNPVSLRRIRKMETLEEIERGVRNAKNAGLNVLLTVMVGYPWEGEDEVRQTVRFVRKLLRYKAKVGDCLQASIIIPYPGTSLHREALEEGLFDIDPEDYESYDMSKAVLRTPIDSSRWCSRLWRLHFDPVFLLRCLSSLRSIDQMRLSLEGVASLLDHTSDFEAY